MLGRSLACFKGNFPRFGHKQIIPKIAREVCKSTCPDKGFKNFDACKASRLLCTCMQRHGHIYLTPLIVSDAPSTCFWWR